jgi:hypothetical protein
VQQNERGLLNYGLPFSHKLFRNSCSLLSALARLAYNHLGMTLEETLIPLWRQILVERAAAAEIDGKKYPATRTATSRLWQLDFAFEGRVLQGLEQNPNTQSRSAELARSGKRVMQFLDGGRYLGVVVDGKLILHGKIKAAN